MSCGEKSSGRIISYFRRKRDLSEEDPCVPDPEKKSCLTMYSLTERRGRQRSVVEKNRNSRLLGHVNFDGQNHRFVRKGNKNGFISGFGHYFPDFG